MEDNKVNEIQDDEIKNENLTNEQQQPETEETTPKEEPVQDKNKRHKGRHNNDKALEEAKSQLEEQKKLQAELSEKYLLLYSDFDNYKKRTAKEKLEMTATAAANVIKEMLPVLDDFERALQNMEKNGNEADLQGVTLIYNKLKSTLQKKGLEEIDAINQEFNTDEHEALTLIPAPDESMKNKVIDVIQKGYKLNGTVIRYARVVVGN